MGDKSTLSIYLRVIQNTCHVGTFALVKLTITQHYKTINLTITDEQDTHLLISNNQFDAHYTYTYNLYRVSYIHL